MVEPTIQDVLDRMLSKDDLGTFATKSDIENLSDGLIELINNLVGHVDQLEHRMNYHFKELRSDMRNIQLGLSDTVRRSEFDEVKHRVSVLENNKSG